MILAKFWIHISQEEQLCRFEARRDTAYKSWKLTDEDWRNRERWDQYEAAVEDMLLRTSTLTAPWTIVEGNDKWFARVKTLRTLVEVLSQELNYQPMEPRIVDTQFEKGESDMAKKEEGKKKGKKKDEKKGKKKGEKKGEKEGKEKK